MEGELVGNLDGDVGIMFEYEDAFYYFKRKMHRYTRLIFLLLITEPRDSVDLWNSGDFKDLLLDVLKDEVKGRSGYKSTIGRAVSQLKIFLPKIEDLPDFSVIIRNSRSADVLSTIPKHFLRRRNCKMKDVKMSVIRKQAKELGLEIKGKKKNDLRDEALAAIADLHKDGKATDVQVDFYNDIVEGETAVDDEPSEEEIKKAKEARAKTRATKKEKKPKGPGIISTIIEVIEDAKKKGITKDAILDVLEERFPDRQRDAMARTVGVQLGGRLKKEKGLNIKSKVVENGDTKERLYFIA